MAKVLLVDGHSLLFRAYHALPPLARPDGTPTGAVYGFATMLLKVLEDTKPDVVAVAFDTGAPTFRHEQFEAYKAQREEAPDEFRVQVPLAFDLLKYLGVPVLVRPGFEADDILGTLAVQASAAGHDALILTGDRDLLQLVRPRITVLLTTRGGVADVVALDAEGVKARMGVRPDQIADLKGLMGDASDNIPGVPGIGAKSAVELLTRYGTIDGVYQALDTIPEARFRKALTGQEQAARQSRDLATIRTDLDVSLPEGEPFRLRATPELLAFLERLGFQSLLRRLKGSPSSGVLEPGASPVVGAAQGDPEDFLPSWPAEQVVAISRVAADVWQVAGAHTAGRYRGTPAPRPDQVLVGFGVKPWVLDAPEGLTGRLYDAEIAAYLLDPGRNRYTLEDVVAQMDQGAPGNLQGLARVWPAVERLLKERGQWELFEAVEMPLVGVLARMERAGIRVDRDLLGQLGGELAEAIRAIEEDIWQLAGGPFNLNSPPQLGEVLFERLGLPTLKRTKTGYSTDADTLEALRPLHPIVDKVLTYRQLAKLKGTYVDGLFPLIGPDERIHTHFNQTVTATGRLSSSDPNLQNIPVRLPLGRRVRRVFLPSPDHVLLAADYSQIELRLLAHLADDPVLVAAFRDGEDIHRRTAAEMFGLAVDEVTDDLRNQAKAINFGIIYGISDYGLATNTGISPREAGAYIERYFARYPQIKRFLDGAVEDARRQGYVTTMLGRRRYLPDIHAANRVRRQYAERTAMNTVIQGSAADLIKVAMVRVDREMRRRGLNSRMVLQVHDELIWDVLPAEETDLARLAVEIMSTAFTLRVPLVVDVKHGPNWEALERWEGWREGRRDAGAAGG
jgi:DNA polymerase-1